MAKSFGADHVVNYWDEKWPEIVKKLTRKGKGVDIVYDPVGMVNKSTKCKVHGLERPHPDCGLCGRQD